MKMRKLDGLVAATYTPLDPNGNVNVAMVAPVVEYLLQRGVNGLYVCGSTGEGMSLSSSERMVVAEAYVKAVDGRVPVMVQVGHNSISESRRLAEHAKQIAADAISATCPSYFKVSDVSTLVQCMAEIAGAAKDLPFYYYHIPVLTGSQLDMVQFLKCGGDRIGNLVGLKYTDTKLFEFQECLELEDARFDVVWGCDEMLLGALATGGRAGIGSTYNIATPLYHQIINAFTQGDLNEARRLQSLSVKMIRTLNRFPFHPAMKAVLGMSGFDMGGCRLPLGNLSESDISVLRTDLDAIGFFQWSENKVEDSRECSTR
tara:strand:+ start:412118 stop:413065 length:948 start_codon:yes stop_codon:yes gene_type:complete